MTTKTKSASKYTPAMVAAMREAAPLNLEKATALAALPMFAEAGITARGIGAKARTEGIAYEAAKRTDKTGAPVAQKADLVEQIASALGVSGIESLAKAEKPTLQIVLKAILDLTAE